MLDILKNKENLVFVGGFAMVKHGLKTSYNDLDVVVTDMSGLEDATTYTTRSAFSKSGKRAFIPGNPKIDIFIEDMLPEYVVIEGYKVASINDFKTYYQRLKQTEKHSYWINHINERLEILASNSLGKN